MMGIKHLLATTVAAFALFGSAQASVINGSFESNFASWTATGHAYLVTDTGSGRNRHDYVNYLGWEGADVWFGGAPQDGSTYAVFGSNGNESDGSVYFTTTASNQFLSFWTSGNSSSGVPQSQRAFAEIFDGLGNLLTTVYTVTYNDSVWRESTIDLAALGLNAGDTYTFKYTDGYSWSVLDNVAESGPALAGAVPAPGTLALAAAGLLMLRRRKSKATA